MAVDLKALTDAELDQLQLDVNGEVARRLAARDLSEKFAEVIAAAEAAGVTPSAIDTAVNEGKTKAKDPERKRDPDWTPPQVATKEPRKVAKSQEDVQKDLAKQADAAYKEAVALIGDGDNG